ncbi:MAG: galactose oxidase-like domain-containing protein, partial [Pseudomonadota bacterium]
MTRTHRSTALSNTLVVLGQGRAVCAILLCALVMASSVRATDSRPGWMMAADDFSGAVVGGRTDMHAFLDEFNGGPLAHIDGAFSDVADWPLGAIHAVLTPLGTVLTYGTAPDDEGVQQNNSGILYDVWNPLLGLSPAAHTTLDIFSPTNIFCSAHVVLPGSGNVLITGGDQKHLPGGVANESIDHVNVFNPATQSMTLLSDSMAYPRWYPTITTLPNGEQLVPGGRLAQNLPSDESGVTVPEIYNSSTGWRSLTGATSQALWGYGWYYPRAFVTPTSGKVLSFKDYRKEIFLIDPSGDGSIEQIARHDIILSAQDMPAVMYRPGKIMTIYNQHAFLVDVSTSDVPVISQTQALIDQRHDSDATILFDGSVLLSGGSRGDQVLSEAVFPVDIWSPDTGTWHRGASAQMERFYHSSALLLPNGTVLTAGGGPPGPVANINAEIYYPPYLFKPDGSGELAPRPVIESMGQARYGAAFQVEVDDATAITSVAAIRTGAVTHSFDQAQRYVPLDFELQSGLLSVSAPANANLAPPGQYMLVVTDNQGVPSEGRLFQLINSPGATLLTPTTDAELADDTLAVSWTPKANATRYQILLGSQDGGRDLGIRTLSETQALMRNLPTDGRDVFVTLRYLDPVDGWQVGDSTRVSAASWPPLRIASHSADDTLASDSVVFTWAAIPDATRYQVHIGSAAGLSDLGLRSTDTAQATVRNLPTDGRSLFASLRYRGTDEIGRA